MTLEGALAGADEWKRGEPSDEAADFVELLTVLAAEVRRLRKVVKNAWREAWWKGMGHAHSGASTCPECPNDDWLTSEARKEVTHGD